MAITIVFQIIYTKMYPLFEGDNIVFTIFTTILCPMYNKA